MSGTLTNIGMVLLFVVIGGVFAAAEIALVSLRQGQVRSIATKGKRGARVARLAEDPNRFLSAVQIGVTMAGFFSAAYGATTLSDDLAPLLVDLGLSERAADTMAFILITLLVAYFSLVLGELVPKRLALQRAERVALVLAPMVDRIAVLSRPLIWLLSASTNIVVRMLGGNPAAGREQISDQELRELVAAHEGLTAEERAIVGDVFSAGDRQVREVMLPRTEVDFLDGSIPVFKAVTFAAERPHSRYPVVHGSPDEVLGFIHVRDLFDPRVASRSLRVGDLSREVLRIPGTKRVLPALTEMRRAGSHLAIVLDEYGGTAGIVTLEDLVEELVGEIRDEYDTGPQAATRRIRAGVVDVDGLLNLEDFADETGVELPDGPYETVAGYVVAVLGHLPRLGDSVDVDGHRLTVTELDGRRISRLRLTPIPTEQGPGAPADTSGRGRPDTTGESGGRLLGEVGIEIGQQEVDDRRGTPGR